MYVVGCTESYRRQEIAKATARILDRAGIKFNMLGKKEQCCGSPLLRTGQTDIVKDELIPQNIENLENWGVEEVVTACSGGFNTWTNDYPKVYGKLPFKILHISQYVERLLAEGRIELKKPLNKKVTYHDPCHLGRHVGVYDEPRNVLKALPGVEFVEMERIRVRSRCCGAGGGFKIAFNDKATTIGVKRVKEAIETEAELMVTTCPFCKTNLNHGADALGSDLRTYDLVELMLESMGGQ